MATYSLLDTLTGPSAGDPDTAGIVVGLEFSVSAPANLTAIRWWQPESDNSTADRTVALYESDGSPSLVTAGPVAPTGTGWQEVAVSSTALTPGTAYVACVLHPEGKYPGTGNWWLSGPGASGVTNGILSAPSAGDSEVGQNRYRSPATEMEIPTSTFDGGNYWVDVVVDDGGDPDPEPTDEGSVIVWNGTSWDEAEAVYWDGSGWVTGEPVEV